MKPAKQIVFLVDVDDTLLENGHVLIYVHKEEALADVERRYPADHYVMVDDKLRILAATKKVWGDHVTTVFPRQGKFANDPEALAAYPPADVTVERIGDLLSYKLSDLGRTQETEFFARQE